MSLKQDNTSKIIEKCIAAIDANAPINISFITQPISKACVDRIKSLEKIYSQSKLYQFLIKKGVYPTLLFSAVSGSVGYGAYRTYHRSTKLVLNLLGVIYPTYCCWHLVKSQLHGQEEQLKSWLTYWMIFGSFQVLDHWMASDLFMFSRKKYNLYKLLILYWAQSPHSKGALLLYRHVIQKPIMRSLDREQEEEEEDIEEEKHLSTEREQHHIESYRIIDGYSPPNLMASCEGQNEERLKYHQQQEHQSLNGLSNEKEAFPPILMNTAEAAW
ncbi:TB2/DP1, HVA22 family-domain-containing protein [Mucor lusitanicus]|uniref:Protein YOP1 n=1 Tax=Mucor circinelloides f. lusitanicus TaxID=29924 RepID=A0A8H4BKQ9_MUCCL|nr:TB2/DP1, HVA22 family-domain-containing protein [Mucor lusitanicus]